ncbi:MAG: polysaccharide deacetylase family protein [Synergistaceae bacterium]|nr:polysaccharide deacetylase family protein [Synergistota bacterium]NLM71869.1 polysaccharide deacetylase family protein [Synergistaceae bacterium]
MRVRNAFFRILLLSLVITLAAHGRAESKSPVYSGDRMIRTIAITFDDGPHPTLTPDLLDTLDSLDVKASFFLVGKMVDKNPAIVREIFARGHTVGNHSYEHRNSSTLTDKEFSSDILRCSEAIERNIPVRVRFFRPPGGNYTRSVLSLVEEVGLSTVLWDINSRDYTGVSPAKMSARIISKSSPGSIILFHSGVSSTIEALPAIVETLRQNGYEFVTLDEMLSEYSAHRLEGPRVHS